MKNVLEVKNLTKTYPGFKLEDVSFTVGEGEVMGFVGRNGAGKTTTLKSILNLVHPDKGEVQILDMAFMNHEDDIKKQIGYVIGGTSYYKRRTIKKIVDITKSFYDNWVEEDYRHYSSVFKLDENKKLMELSEGMKVKFYLTMALSHQAKLLILDEPTSGLDPVSREELLDIFMQLAHKGVSILFSTHITSDLEKCADKVTYIKNGKILASMNKTDFIHHYEKEIGHVPTLEDIMVHIEKEEVVL